MVRAINLLRNVGRFDNVNAGAQIVFSKLTVIYAENARGKSTLAAMMRSLATGKAELVSERARLGATHPPHIVIDTGTAPPVVFQGGAWSRTVPDIVVFDDAFVAENVCAGIEVGTTQRQNLHELIVGAQGIALARAVQAEIDRVEVHNRDLRDKENAIPAGRRGPLNIEQFCALQPVNDLERLIEEAEKRLAAAREAGRIAGTATFGRLLLPRIDLNSLSDLLDASLPNLDAEALQRVQAHVGRLGRAGEAWVGQGLQLAERNLADGNAECPFCAQDLAGSSLLAHYRAYFSEAYNAFRQRIIASAREFRAAHGGDVQAAFERSVRETVERLGFWKAFSDVPALEIDTAAIARTWKIAREHIERLLDAKLGNPLEAISIPQDVVRAVADYNIQCERIEAITEQLAIANAGLDIVKEQARDANVAVLTSDLANLKAVEARYDPAVSPLCDAYLAEKAAKTATEARRNAARRNLD